MSDPDLAFTLAEYAASLRLEDLPVSTVQAAKLNLLDTLACAVDGSSAPGAGEVVDLVTEWGGAPQATVLVHGMRLPAHHAAWANGVMAHSRDYDDTYDVAVLHAGVSVVPAALAAAELHGNVSGAELLPAVVAGLDVICRLGEATKVGLTESGWIYSSLFGYFGATVAAGRVLRLDAESIANALGIVYSQVAGNHQVTRDGALTKRMQPAFAAKAALISVQLSQRGIRGARSTFQGEDGFLRVYLGNRFDPSTVVADLGWRFRAEELSYKLYPCCRFTHAPIDAALALRSQLTDPRSDIRRVTVRTTRQCYEAVCTPVEVRKAPRNTVHAQFSIPYTVATALIQGWVGLASFDDKALRWPEVLNLAARVDCEVDDVLEREWGRSIAPVIVCVETHDGRRLEQRVDYPRGHPRNPMSSADLDRKLADCLAFSARPLTVETGHTLRHLIENLEQLDDTRALSRCLVSNQVSSG